jgi:hypothetical protein
VNLKGKYFACKFKTWNKLIIVFAIHSSEMSSAELFSGDETGEWNEVAKKSVVAHR